jgi:hypothetical protein
MKAGKLASSQNDGGALGAGLIPPTPDYGSRRGRLRSAIAGVRSGLVKCVQARSEGKLRDEGREPSLNGDDSMTTADLPREHGCRRFLQNDSELPFLAVAS